MVDSRFKKALVAFGGAALLTASALPAVAQEEAPLFVAINKSADQVYFIDLQRGFDRGRPRNSAARRSTFDAKLDPSLGVSLVNDAISAGAVGIAITVPDQTIGPAVVDVTSQAGVALVATDDNITDAEGNAVPFVGFDGVEMGTKMGDGCEPVDQGGWLEDESHQGRRPIDRGPDPVGLRGPHQRSQATMLDAGVPPENHLPGAIHRRDPVGAGCRGSGHHGSP